MVYFYLPHIGKYSTFLRSIFGSSGCSFAYIPYRNTILSILYHYFYRVKVISTSVKFHQFIVFTVYSEKVCWTSTVLHGELPSVPMDNAHWIGVVDLISWWLTHYYLVVSTLIFVVSNEYFKLKTFSLDFLSPQSIEFSPLKTYDIILSYLVAQSPKLASWQIKNFFIWHYII